MRRTVLIAGALLGALLTGCAMKKPEVSRPCVVVFKTPQWRFADTGYVRTGEGVAELEVFEAGQRVLRLQIENAVCVEGEGCVSKADFNARYLNAAYPADLLYHLLRAEPVFGREGLRRTESGFEQRIVTPSVDILYRVEGRQVYFKDRKNRIMIKLKPITQG